MSETALFLSQWLGARELALLGVDLASDDPRYAIRFETPDVTGRPVVTNSSYHHSRRYLDWRCPKLEHGGIPVWRPQAGLPILTDVHETWQAKIVAEVADCLQVPAFLSRQTDLIAACAATGRAINLKKGQFMAPREVAHAVEKAHTFGAESVMVTERGTTFGYHDLVVDFRGFAEIRRHAPLCFDATHAVQHPGAGEAESRGDRRGVPPLVRAAVAVGVDALFIEVHPEPDCAPCDGLCQLRIEDMDRLLTQVEAIAAAVPLSGDAKI